MNSKRAITPILWVVLTCPLIGLLAGCEAGSGQIPLANVPPPPEGFAATKNASKLPNGASPIDANSRRK